MNDFIQNSPEGNSEKGEPLCEKECLLQEESLRSSTAEQAKKRTFDQLESGARIEVGDQKEDPLDFALWKKDEKFGYKSPWGVGRPGWHIE